MSKSLPVPSCGAAVLPFPRARMHRQNDGSSPLDANAARQRISELFAEASPAPVQPPSALDALAAQCDPLDVLQSMIECYFNALQTQLNLVKQQKRN